MSTEVQLVPTKIIEDGSLITKLQTDLPRLYQGMSKTLQATQAIQAVTKEDRQTVMELMVRVRNTYGKMEALRKEGSGMLDALKAYMMAPEKAVEKELERLRLLVQKLDQEAIQEENRKKEEARQQKLRDQAWIDLKARVKTAINEVIIQLCARVENGSRDYFSGIATLEDFDKKASTYQNTRWKMKVEDYDRCFVVAADPILPKEEVGPFLEKLKQEIPYETVNAMYVEKAGPLITIWKTKIPQLRDTLTQMLKASEEEKVRLAEKAKASEEAEAARSTAYLQEQQHTMNRSVDAEMGTNKIETELREQAIHQTIEPTGPKKKVLRFLDEKNPTPLCEIIYHCFLHPKFKGIYNGKEDAQGRKEYIDAVDWWAKEFVRLKVDASIKGTEIVEDAKVIVRA